MIKIENTEVYGWETAIKYIRNLKDNCGESDSGYCLETLACHSCRWNRKTEVDCKANIDKHSFVVGKNDLKLMKTIAQGGTDHGDFLEMINVTIDITAPLYWWNEFDTYKVDTLPNSCSIMHKIHAKEFTLEDFSCEHLIKVSDSEFKDEVFFEDSYHIRSRMIPTNALELIIAMLNHYRRLYLETKDKKCWWQMIQLLPSSYNQKRAVQLNYAVLKTIYFACKDHKLDEWHIFCDWILSLPYFKEICLED